MSSGLLFKEAEHYSQIYGINLQTVIKGMTEISISIFKTRKKKTKKPCFFLPRFYSPSNQVHCLQRLIVLLPLKAAQ